jgi:hypothetical protein
MRQGLQQRRRRQDHQQAAHSICSAQPPSLRSSGSLSHQRVATLRCPTRFTQVAIEASRSAPRSGSRSRVSLLPSLAPCPTTAQCRAPVANVHAQQVASNTFTLPAKSCRLTWRSTGHATACHPAREAPRYMLHLAGRAARRGAPVNSTLAGTTRTRSTLPCVLRSLPALQQPNTVRGPAGAPRVPEQGPRHLRTRASLFPRSHRDHSFYQARSASADQAVFFVRVSTAQCVGRGPGRSRRKQSQPRRLCWVLPPPGRPPLPHTQQSPTCSAQADTTGSAGCLCSNGGYLPTPQGAG